MSEMVLAFEEKAFKAYAPAFARAGGLVSNRAVMSLIAADVFRPNGLRYVVRAAAETDPSWKQVIPYCVLRRGGEVYAYQRTKKGGEARLHDRWSLGVGGHINPADGSAIAYREAYDSAYLRELAEEVGFRPKAPTPPAAYLYDPSNDVGKVHFGVVHVVDVPERAALNCKDPALANGVWVPSGELAGRAESFENWSQLVIRKMDLAA
jgi:predicted NUDIX family phosphoesterase